MNASTAIDGLPGSGKASRVLLHKRTARPNSAVAAGLEPHHKRLNRAGNVLQVERPNLLESEIEPPMHMVAHRSRDADAARRTFSLNSCRNIHRVSVQISPVCNRVADVDPDAEADGAIGWLVAIMVGTCCCTFTAQRTAPSMLSNTMSSEIATGLDDPAAMLLDRRIDHVAAERTQPFERSHIIQADQTAVADHVGIDDGDQLPPIWRPSDQV